MIMGVYASQALLVSDMDGTLLKDDKTIHKEDYIQLHKWEKLGGRFTIATGRSILSAKNHLESLPVNCPAILFNGSVIYDYQKNKTLYCSYLSNSFASTIRFVKESFPEVGIELMQEDLIQLAVSNEIVKRHIENENLQYEFCSLDNLPDRIIKVLFGVPEPMVEHFCDSITLHLPSDIYCIQTDKMYVELLQKGVNKNTGLMKMKQLLGLENQYTIAIGDYYNDFELLQDADFGVAVANAQDTLKSIARYETKSNQEAAIADTIRFLFENNIIFA